MELKEYIQIIKKQYFLVIAIIIATVLIAEGYFIFRQKDYNISLLINITRTGTQETTDFRYDDFYRLQADEKFTETLVQWLKSPRVVLDILDEAGVDTKDMNLRKLSKAIRPEKMSSQVILISYVSQDSQTAKKISQSIINVISKKTEDLNEDQKNNTWFKIISNDPVIVKNQIDLVMVFFASLLMGFFLSFWLAILRHYLK